MLFGKNKDSNTGMATFDEQYADIEAEIDGSVWHKELDQFGQEIMDTFRDTGALAKVIYQPCDDLKGSISLYMTFLPDDHFMKVWHHNTKVGFAFYRKLHGAMELLIPETFSDSGIGVVSSLDEFLDMFTEMMAKKTYNMKETKEYT